VRKLPPDLHPVVQALWCQPKCFRAMADHLAVLEETTAAVESRDLAGRSAARGDLERRSDSGYTSNNIDASRSVHRGVATWSPRTVATGSSSTSPISWSAAIRDMVESARQSTAA
jgi:hypothetical protein